MPKPRLIVFASGSKDGGGSGFRNLVLKSREGILNASIVGVVSNHLRGGVYRHAKDLDIPFCHMPKPYLAEYYKSYVVQLHAEWIALSGWLKLVSGLPVEKTFNIHPGPLPDFGGPGLYGHFVHEAVLKACHEGKISHSAVTMHFVSEKYDRGPIFFRYPVQIKLNDTPDSLGQRVNQAEHEWQAWATNLVVNGQIRLENSQVIVPQDYKFL